MKGKEGEIFLYLQKLIAKEDALTLVEVLVTSLILGIIITALFLTLNIGNLSIKTTELKSETISQARMITDWLIQDLRQTFAYEIRNNDPSSGHIKFRLCQGHDGRSIQWSEDYIEYIYDNINQTLIRFDYNYNPPRENVFKNIIVENIDNEPFDLSQLNSNKITITIRVSKANWQVPQITQSLISEAKIRNE